MLLLHSPLEERFDVVRHPGDDGGITIEIILGAATGAPSDFLLMVLSGVGDTCVAAWDGDGGSAASCGIGGR